MTSEIMCVSIRQHRATDRPRPGADTHALTSDAPFHSAPAGLNPRTPPSRCCTSHPSACSALSGHLLTCYQDLAFWWEDQRRWEMFPPPVCRLSSWTDNIQPTVQRFFPHSLGPTSSWFLDIRDSQDRDKSKENNTVFNLFSKI